MKVAVVYNRESKNVINLFGVPNRERYGLKAIKRITDALKEGGRQVTAFEADKDLIERLESFMPRVLKGERPGIVFNLSYGIQGQARYTHVPSILEMVGIPYVGSGPLAHSLALDKVVAKMIFKQNNLPTPDFAVLQSPDSPPPDLPYPLIVKPKNEAVSFGLRIVRDEAELREGAAAIFKRFQQPVLVERYIEGREINVGLLGNDPVQAFQPAELLFDKQGPAIYTYEDKTHRSGREIKVACPAKLDSKKVLHAQDIAVKAFNALGCYDCCRVDMRMDKAGNLFLLEVNSLPSLGEHGSYTAGAKQAGMDFSALVNRLVDVAYTRYFGTPKPPPVRTKEAKPEDVAFNYLTEKRDQMEKRLQEWVDLPSRTHDPVGLQAAEKLLDETLREMGMKPVPALSDERSVLVWETAKGLDNGTLLIGHLDVPLDAGIPLQPYRKEPEELCGEGIGCSRAPLVMMEFALRALRRQQRLRHTPLGVLYYMDEGRDARYSGSFIRQASARAKNVIVLRPGNPGGRMIIRRRGHRKYRLEAQGPIRKLGYTGTRPDTFRWATGVLEGFARLSSRKARVAMGVTDFKTYSLPLCLPHWVQATLLLTYPDEKTANMVERQLREIAGKSEVKWRLELISDRPPMQERRAGARLVKQLAEVARKWELPFDTESSTWPSVAGLVPFRTAAVCGFGPVAEHLNTFQEKIDRISLLQRTLLLAQFLFLYTEE